jgi:hypothetical protein
LGSICGRSSCPIRPFHIKDVDGKLAKIRQTSFVSEYQSRFECLANHAHDWSKRQLIGTFVEGLRSDIRREVKTYRPRTIVATFSFARVQEEKLSEETCRTTRASSRPVNGSGGSSSALTLKTTHLTQEELKEKQQRGFAVIVMTNGIEDMCANRGNSW